MPAETQTGFGPTARPQAGPDGPRWMLLLRKHRHDLGQTSHCPCLVAKGQSPHFSLLVKGTAFCQLPWAVCHPQSWSRKHKVERKKREQEREERRRKLRNKEGARKRERGEEFFQSTELAPNQKT